jgi:hypothetical protein
MKSFFRLSWLALAGINCLIAGCVIAPQLSSDAPLSGTPRPMLRLVASVNPGVGYETPYSRDKKYMGLLKQRLTEDFLKKSIPVRTVDGSLHQVIELNPPMPNVSELDQAIAAEKPTHVMRMTVVKATLYNFSVTSVVWQVEIFQEVDITAKSFKGFAPISIFTFSGPGCSAGLAQPECATKLSAGIIENLQRKGFVRP